MQAFTIKDIADSRTDIADSIGFRGW